MNYLVFLDPWPGELEKILSGVKTMVLKEFDLVQPPAPLVRPGDSLYFLRDKDEYVVRVKASVVHLSYCINGLDADLPRTLKELQPKLQLTENQFNYWSTRQEVQLVEFDCAHKIEVIHVAMNKATGHSRWIAFEQLRGITE